MKGSECLDKFMEMQECMKDFPDLYKEKDPMPDERELEEAEAQSAAANAAGAKEKEEATESSPPSSSVAAT